MKILIKELIAKIKEKASIALQLCNAIEYAHQNAILHCDIKPDNIMFDIHNQLKVLDFGLSHVLGGESQAATIGSPAFLAPELYLGQNKVICLPLAPCYLSYFRVKKPLMVNHLK